MKQSILLQITLGTALGISVLGCTQHPVADQSSASQFPAAEPSRAEDSPCVVKAPGGPRWIDAETVAPMPNVITADGQLVLVNTNCETVLYELATHKRLHAWHDRNGLAQFSGDGKRLLMVHGRNRVTLWDTSTLAEVQRFEGVVPDWETTKQYPGTFMVAVDHRGSQVAISNERGKFNSNLPDGILVFDVNSGELQAALPLHERVTVESIEFLRGRDRLLCSFAGHAFPKVVPDGVNFRLWNTQTAEALAQVPPGEQVVASPDGRWLASASLLSKRHAWEYGKVSSPTHLTLWSGDTGERLKTFEHPYTPREFTFDPTGERLLIALQSPRDVKVHDSTGKLIEWEVGTGNVVWESDESDSPYASVDYSSDGRRRFATSEFPADIDEDVEHHLQAWSVSSGEKLPIGEYNFASFNGSEKLFFFPPGDRFIDLSVRYAVRDVLTGAKVDTLPPYRRGRLSVAFTPDGQKFLVTGNTPLLTDWQTGKQREWPLHGSRYAFVDQGRAVYGHSNLVDVASGKIYYWSALHGPYGALDSAISPDTKHFVTAHRIHDGESGVRLALVESARPDDPRILKRNATTLAMRADGLRFLAATDQGIEEFDWNAGKSLGVLWTPPGRVLCLKYSPDERLVFAGGITGHQDLRQPIFNDDEGWATLWNLESGTATELEGHAGPITTAAFRQDSTRLVTGSNDATMRLWNTSGHSLHVFRGHLGAIRGVAYRPGGDSILSAAQDGAAVWNAIRFNRPPEGLAESFTVVETIYPFSDRGHAQTALGIDVHPPASPTAGKGKFTLIEVGDRSRAHDPPQGIKHWLKQAKVHLHVKRAETAPEEPAQRYSYDLGGKSRDGRKAFIDMTSKEVILVDPEGNTQKSWKGRFSAATISPSGAEVVIVHDIRAGDEKTFEVHFYNTDTDATRLVVDDLDARWINGIKVAPDEQTFLVHYDNSHYELRDYATGRNLAELEPRSRTFDTYATYSPDGQYVVSRHSSSPYIDFRSPRTLAIERTLENQLIPRTFRFSPDGKQLLVAQRYADGRPLVALWDLESDRRLWSRASPYAGGTISEDGRRILSKVAWDVWTLWDLERGVVLCAIHAEDSSLSRPVLDPSGKSLHRGTLAGPELWPDPSLAILQP